MNSLFNFKIGSWEVGNWKLEVERKEEEDVRNLYGFKWIKNAIHERITDNDNGQYNLCFSILLSKKKKKIQVCAARCVCVC